jgi:glycosyltransferase involved in cell wall biosynthesis
MKISAVIICKNGSTHLAETILSVKGICDEILVYDSGSSDDSLEIAEDFGARVERGTWEGYGRNRYKAAQLATYDWILMLDTDEVPDEELRTELMNIDLAEVNMVYRMRYKNYFGTKLISFGEWGNDSHIRMANRKKVTTDQEIVHEKLFLKPGLSVRTLNGHILHYTVNNSREYANKMMEYAVLSAEKYHASGKRSSALKIWGSPLFAFVQNYFFKLGFLDGWKGFVCAGMTSWYTFMKYVNLRELDKQRLLELGKSGIKSVETGKRKNRPVERVQ